MKTKRSKRASSSATGGTSRAPEPRVATRLAAGGCHGTADISHLHLPVPWTAPPAGPPAGPAPRASGHHPELVLQRSRARRRDPPRTNRSPGVRRSLTSLPCERPGPRPRARPARCAHLRRHRDSRPIWSAGPCQSPLPCTPHPTARWPARPEAAQGSPVGQDLSIPQTPVLKPYSPQEGTRRRGLWR